jgi:anion-transporting  ArsA/GET3 family ATPase
MKLAELIRTKEVVVCCGAGGVGKTTTSAALGLAAARAGRRALVLTIDPARRLAQALGIPPMGNAPVQIDAALLEAAGVNLPPGAELHAWMLDPKVVLESIVDRFAPDEDAKRRIRETRLYKALSEVMTGLQEYTAAEALYDFNEQGRFDLIILDTPPSRNALDFLDAPRRLARFLDERTLSLFAPDAFAQKSSTLVRAASKVVHTAISKAFGESFANELQHFLGAFGTLFGKMRLHAKGVRQLLMSDKSAFIVITSPEEMALEEALFFKRRIAELGLVAEGFVLNRSYATDGVCQTPAELIELEGWTTGVDAEALRKLGPLADHEMRRGRADRELLETLVREGRREGGQGAIALPYLDEAVEDIPALAQLSSHILASD